MGAYRQEILKTKHAANEMAVSMAVNRKRTPNIPMIAADVTNHGKSLGIGGGAIKLS